MPKMQNCQKTSLFVMLTNESNPQWWKLLKYTHTVKATFSISRNVYILCVSKYCFTRFYFSWNKC